MTETKRVNVPKILLQDETFDTNKSNRYHLSLLHNGNEFLWVVLDKDENKYIYLSNNTNWESLTCGWNSVSCAIVHNKFTLVPNALFDEENKYPLLGFTHEIKEDEEVEVNHLYNSQAKNLFTIKKELLSSIRKQFPNTYFIHSTTSFIEGVMAMNRNNSVKRAFANFVSRNPSAVTHKTGTASDDSSSFLEIVILDGKKLQFCNSFKYQSADEIAYYILFVYEQLNLNVEKVELILSGEIEKMSKEHLLLYNYIRHVKFASRPEEFRYSYKFEEVASHRFFSLFTQYLVR